MATQPRQVEAELSNAAELAGAVALVDRGVVPFAEKAERAAAAGAVALIVVNTEENLFSNMGVEDSPIPVLMARKSAGEALASGAELALTVESAAASAARAAEAHAVTKAAAHKQAADVSYLPPLHLMVFSLVCLVTKMLCAEIEAGLSGHGQPDRFAQRHFCAEWQV